MFFGPLRFSSCAARHGGRTTAMNMASLHKGDSVHYKHACIKPAKYKEMHPPKKQQIDYEWWMSVRLSSHYSTWCLFVLAAGTQGDPGCKTTWLEYHGPDSTKQWQPGSSHVFLVDHPKIFNFLLDDPKVSWDTWVTVVIQQTLPLADVFL